MKRKLPPYVVIKFGRWHVRRTFPSTETYPNGKVKRIEITRRCDPETEDRANEISSGIEAAVKFNKSEAVRPKTVAEYISIFLDTKKGSVERRTHQDYLNWFERYVNGSSFGRLTMPVTVKDVQTFFNSLKPNVSPEMMHKVYVLLSMVFRQAIVWGDLEKNPAIGVILPKVIKKEADALTVAEAKRLSGVLRTNPNWLIFELTLETGMRPQEAIVISWSDIDLVRCRVRINKALADGEIKAPKTKASVRTVSFSPYMRDRLIEHKKNQSGDLVFPSANGTPKALHNWNCREFKPALKKAGLSSKYSFKSLRHTNASILAEKISPKRLQKHLGHERIETTLSYYVHVDSDKDSEISEMFVKEIY